MKVPIINNPCPEKWEGMTPVEQGRFCGKCSKIVIDFTKKTTREIIDFLNARKGEDICGKLRLQPLRVRVKPRMKIFTAALYLVFGSLLFSACGPTEHEEPVGKVGIDSATEAQMHHYSDSIAAVDSAKTTKVDSASVIDSADIMSTVRVLDSIAALKKK